MKMHDAGGGLWLPEGVTRETMYQGDAMMNQVMEICGVNDLIEPPKPKPPITKEKWVTKEGKQIAVTEMDNEHLPNTINMLRRNAEIFRLSFIMDISRYIEGAPDGAADAAEAECTRAMEMTVDEFLSYKYPCFPLMLEEAKRRGLEATLARIQQKSPL